MADPVAAAAPLSGADPFEVGYVDGVGRVVRSALKQCWHVRFEDCRPSRAFPVYRGRQNFTAVGGTARLPTMLHAAGITTPLNCWVAHEHDVCLRHQRLIGTGCQSTQGPRRPPAAAPCLPRPTTPPQPAGTTRPTLASWTPPRSPGHLPEVLRAARVPLTARSRPPDGRPCQRHTAPSRHERDPARDLPSGDRRTDRPSRLRPLGASALRGQRRVTALRRRDHRREVLAGHELEETDDPLYQWITGRIALHKFTRYYPRSFGALHPEETTRPTRNRPDRDSRLIPLPPY